MKSEIAHKTATREFTIQGLDCADCAHLLEKAVGKMPGILEVRADLINSNLRVEYAPEQVQPGKIIEAIVHAGYFVPPEAALSTIAFAVEGLDCGEEEKLIRQALHDMEGVDRLEFFLISGALQVHYNPSLITPEAIIRAIARAGFPAQVKRRVATTPSWQSHWPLLRTGVCGLLTALGFTLSWLGFGQFVVDPVYAAAIMAGGYPMARKAMAAARNLKADMNLLMTIAVIGAVGIGEWIEAAVVVFLFSLANILENYSLERARRAIRSLLELSPLEAAVQRNGGEATVPVEDVLLGETLIIRPGSKIPLDGEIIEGGSGVNQAPITGESMPVVKGPGDLVFAGSINGHGSLLVRVTHLAQDSTLARLIHMVEEAQAQKAPSQSFADRFARYYTPLVIIAAGLVMTVPPMVLGQLWADWFYRALVLLVISCPCALVISTPVTIVSGLARAAKNGILIKGGVYLENLATIRVIAFDKTGTLTLGQPTVTKVLPLKNWSPTEVLRLAAAVESRSEHHLAQAILTQARQEAMVISEFPESFEALPGQGVKANLNETTYYVGSHQMFADLGLCDPELCRQVESLENESQTVTVVGSSQGAMGLIVIADRLRPEAVEAVAQLRQAGISKLVMLTGDNPHVARVVANKLGLDDYYAGLMPGDKVEAVKRLGQEAPLAMVGDGVNDAPALAAATVGIAMGAAGSDAAIEAADIALMSDDLSKLPSAIRLSHQGRRIIKANIVLSLATKGVFLLLGIMGLATLWMAVFADMGTSILVILNGLRLYRQSS